MQEHCRFGQRAKRGGNGFFLVADGRTVDP